MSEGKGWGRMYEKDNTMSLTAEQIAKTIDWMNSDITYRSKCKDPLIVVRVQHYKRAIVALREKAARENPEPLTVEQLREMDGQPVFMYWPGDGVRGGEWGVIGIDRDDVLVVRHRREHLARRLMREGYKIYAHKPGGEIRAHNLGADHTWSTVHSFDFGHPVTCPKNSGAWTYDDTGAPAPENRPCPRCVQHRGEDGIDPCLSRLPGVTAACCGHGVEDGYVLFKNGVCIRGRFFVERLEKKRTRLRIRMEMRK